MSDESTSITIAIIGGTGKEGSGLARRWAKHGYHVFIGSRDRDRAVETASAINDELGSNVVVGGLNEDAASVGDIVVLSVPYSAHRSTLESIKQTVQGKILVDVTVPTPFPQAVHIPAGLSAAQEAQAYLGEGVRVVSAFQNVSASKLKNVDEAMDTDVLVCGDDAKAKDEVLAIVRSAGMRGLDAGPLANSVASEALTAVLYYINRKYKSKGAGVRITGVNV